MLQFKWSDYVASKISIVVTYGKALEFCTLNNYFCTLKDFPWLWLEWEELQCSWGQPVSRPSFWTRDLRIAMQEECTENYWNICRAWAVQECRILNCCSSVWASYVRLVYLNGDLTGRKTARASESDVLCGHRAVVCPDSKSACSSACCVSLGQRHSEWSVVQKWPLSVTRCSSVTVVKAPLLPESYGCSWSSALCHLSRFTRHVAPRDVTSPYWPTG